MSRVYVVANMKMTGALDVTFVLAHSRAGAIRHVAEKSMVASVASTEEMFHHMKTGGDIEDATAVVAEAPEPALKAVA